MAFRTWKYQIFFILTQIHPWLTIDNGQWQFIHEKSKVQLLHKSAHGWRMGDGQWKFMYQPIKKVLIFTEMCPWITTWYWAMAIHTAKNQKFRFSHQIAHDQQMSNGQYQFTHQRIKNCGFYTNMTMLRKWVMADIHTWENQKLRFLHKYALIIKWATSNGIHAWNCKKFWFLQKPDSD